MSIYFKTGIPEKPKIETLPQPGKGIILAFFFQMICTYFHFCFLLSFVDDIEQKSNTSLNLFDESVIPPGNFEKSNFSDCNSYFGTHYM